jgi:hypothetical protein
MSGQLHALCHFTPAQIALGTHCIRGQIGPRVGLGAVENKGKTILELPGIAPGPSSASVYRLSYPELLKALLVIPHTDKHPTICLIPGNPIFLDECMKHAARDEKEVRCIVHHVAYYQT